MDPAEVALNVTRLLLPYIVKGGEKFAETLGEKLPEGIGRVWRAIASRFKGKPAAEEAVQDLAARPNDPDSQAAFRKELKKAMAAEPAFAAELAGVLERISSSADILINMGDGAVATHGGTASGAGGVAVARDVHGDINVSSPRADGERNERKKS